MRWLLTGASLLVAGCASLSSDLQRAEAACAPTQVMTSFVTCLNSADEPVWQKESPSSAAAYRQFAAARLALAGDLDGGKITPAQFVAGTADARAKLVTVVAGDARARRQQIEQARADAMVQDFQKPMGSAAGDMGMGGMTGNGMGGM
jgi:hypothetical protein